MINVKELEFHYPGGDFSLRVPALDIAQGETVAVIGPSGSGKTTLLNLLAACTVPHKGSVTVGGKVVSSMDDAARRSFRVRELGLVFQEFELLDYLSVLDNILLPYRITPELVLDSAVQERASMLASGAGIADKLRRRVDCLSQGERQRVAVCRALVTEPTMLLCDEPTGNLDPANSTRVLDIMFNYAREHGSALIAVTHDHESAKRFDRTVDISSIQEPAGARQTSRNRHPES